MNRNIIKRNELLAQKVIKGLESRNMTGYYAASREEAKELALSLIPEGSTVSMGGAMSAHEIGLVQALKEGNYSFIDRDEYEDKRKAMLLAYDADVEITYTETAYGTKLLVASQADKSMVIFYTLYEGYEIEFDLTMEDGTALTQEQIDTCVKFLSDLDLVFTEK